MSTKPPQDALAGLYIHLPFCSAICPYCDFAVLTGNAAARAEYVEMLVSEIELYTDLNLRFDTIYLGGGTPSALTPAQLQAVLDAVRSSCLLASDVPVTLEANPEDVSEESVAAWRSLGVRTLSLGVQSFDNARLRFLGRRHSGAESERSVEVALRAGFDTVSLDLILGTPGQRRAAWKEELRAAIRTGCQHVSCYQLTVHPRTVLGRRLESGRLRELSESGQAGLYGCTHATLAGGGFRAYEVSNFARGPEHRSRHNAKYWTHVPYLGVGLGAHSFREAERWWNERDLDAYRRKLAAGRKPLAGRETLSARDLALETVMLRLRTAEGLDLSGFQRRFGVDLRENNEVLFARLQGDALASLENDRLRLTPRGMAIADAVARDIRLDV